MKPQMVLIAVILPIRRPFRPDGPPESNSRCGCGNSGSASLVLIHPRYRRPLSRSLPHPYPWCSTLPHIRRGSQCSSTLVRCPPPPMAKRAAFTPPSAQHPPPHPFQARHGGEKRGVLPHIGVPSASLHHSVLPHRDPPTQSGALPTLVQHPPHSSVARSHPR